MSEPHIAILGAGPAGAGAAFQLRRTARATVTVLERNNTSGGNAGSFEAAGQRLDYGSHRLHPACDSEILEDIRGLLGNNLLDRPRHGRIRLRGRWIHFPLRPADLLLRLSPGFSMGVVQDLVIVSPRADLCRAPNQPRLDEIWPAFSAGRMQQPSRRKGTCRRENPTRVVSTIFRDVKLALVR